MVATITPAVHGGSRTRWGPSVASHAAGATLSAAGTGAALGVGGKALGAPWGAGGAWVVAAAAGVYAVAALLGLRVPIPALRRQVPEWWRTFFSPATSSFLYGLQLGVGFLTSQTGGAFTVVALAAFVSRRPIAGALLVAPFGLVRGLSPLVACRARSGEAADRLVERLATIASSPVPALATAGTLAGVSAAAGARAVHGGPVAGAELLSAGLAVVFGVAAASKLAGRRAWRRSLDGFALPGALRRAAVVGVPAAEATVAGLVLAGARWGAARLALGLLVAFSAAVLWARARLGARVPCGCFGEAGRTRDYRWLIARNLALAIPAAVVIVRTTAGPWAGLRAPTPADAAAVALAIGGLVLLGWTVRAALRGIRPEGPA